MTTVEVPRGDQLREQAIKRLRKRRDFGVHLLVYLLVNGALTVIWAVTGRLGFFWPVIPMAMWGIGLVMHGYDTYSREQPREDKIRREIDRMTEHG
jgi:hypothetical protein